MTMEEPVIRILLWIIYFASLFLLIYWLVYFLEKRDNIRSDNQKGKPNLTIYPFVSVVIPAYNEENHIIKTLNSVVELDYPKDRYELLIVNDCSTDKTRKVARDFINKYKNKSASYKSFKQ
jgi:cellulose synthase/poly-beta-1,6-N-acetylglucosamine synthase-like glycosyltransferase